MNIRRLIDVALGWGKDNSTVLLAGAAITGVVSTAVLAFKSGYDLGREEEARGIADDPAVRLKEAWPYLVAPVCSAGVTIGAIVYGHKIGERKNLAVTSALAISERTLNEYRGKVAEIVSHRKAEQATEEITAERINKTPPWESEVTKTGYGDVRCYDTYTGRYFLSSRQQIENGVNMLNNQLNNHLYGSLNDLYGFLGLGPTAAGDDLGWNSDHLLEVSFSSHLAEDGDPCLAVYFKQSPMPHFYRR